MSVQSFIFGGDTKQTQESLKRQRAIANALFQDAMGNTPRNLGEGIGAIGKALLARSAMAKADKGDAEMAEAQKSNWSKIGDLLSGGSALAYDPAGATASSSSSGSLPAGASDLKGGIVETANALGIDPVDLGTAISYETGGTFDPTKSGPTTQWGTHRGLIQFGEPQAEKYGVDWKNPVGSQLGANGAVANYLRDAGVKPGMGMKDIYSAINAGRVGRYDASDANNGGAPGTVADKVDNQMAGHRAKAQALLGDASDPYKPGYDRAMDWALSQAGASAPVEVASLDPSAGMDSALGYSPRRGMDAPAPAAGKDKAVAAALAPLPAPQDVAANPVPPQSKFSPRVMAALSGDQGFDGFARTGGNVQGAPAAPAAPMGEPSQPAAPQQGGMNMTVLMQMMGDPTMSDDQRKILAGMVDRQLKPKEYGFSTLPDGTILRQDPRSGTVEPIYQGGTKPTYGVIGKDQFGNEQYGWIDAGKRTTTPSNGSPVAGADQPMADIPPAPAGVDPKEWRKQFSERAATNAMPAKSEDVTGLRKEIQQLPSYKNFSQAAPIYRAMTEAAGRDTKSADLNMVYGLGKIMDPTSVVREGEIVMANDTQGIADKLNGFIAGIQGEGRLRPEARQQIMQEAFGRLSAYQTAFNQDTTFYSGIASRNRIPAEDVIPNFGTFEEWKVPTSPIIREVAPSPAAIPSPVPPAGLQAPPSAQMLQQQPTSSVDTVPAGVDPELWKIATPDERRLWQSQQPQTAPAATMTPDGWQMLPNGVKIRVKQ